jgi:hypothetical protein
VRNASLARTVSPSAVSASRLARPAIAIAPTVAAVVVVTLAGQKQSLEARYRELVARLDDPYSRASLPWWNGLADRLGR